MIGALISFLGAVLLILFGLCVVVTAAAWLPGLCPSGNPRWRPPTAPPAAFHAQRGAILVERIVPDASEIGDGQQTPAERRASGSVTEIAAAEGVSKKYTSRILRLARLAPEDCLDDPRRKAGSSADAGGLKPPLPIILEGAAPVGLLGHAP